MTRPSQATPTIEECRAEIERLRSEQVIHAERHFGERRVVRPAPAFLHRVVRAQDIALNQLKRRDEPEPRWLVSIILFVYGIGLTTLIVGLLAWAGI